MRVLNALKPGLDEKIYENALLIELRKRGCIVEQQRRFNEGSVVGTLVPDLIVENSIVLDPKVAEEFTPSHFSQMIGYLAITQLQLAILINFKHSDLRWRRVVRS